MACGFGVGDLVTNKVELDSDNGLVEIGSAGIVQGRHAGVGSCLYVVRFPSTDSVDRTAPAWEEQLKAGRRARSRGRG